MATPAARQGAIEVTFWMGLFVSFDPAFWSCAANKAKLSSPVARASSLEIRLPWLPLVRLMPSARVSRMRMLVNVEFCTFDAPQTPTTLCSIHTSLLWRLTMLRRSQGCPGRVAGGEVGGGVGGGGVVDDRGYRVLDVLLGEARGHDQVRRVRVGDRGGLFEVHEVDRVLRGVGRVLLQLEHGTRGIGGRQYEP